MLATVHKTFLIFSLIVFVHLKALPAQGFFYRQKAIDKKLWTQTQWLQLGHYEKNIFGSYHSAFRGPLFISEKGFDSPEDELLATIDAFFSESDDLVKRYKQHPQCQFLARRKWLTQQLGIQDQDLLPCPERQNWKKQLNAKSVSLIFAAADLSNPASSYGHTFLKLINPENAGNKNLIDYGVNYAADADSSEGFFYAVKGLLGLYGGTFTMLPYHQKIREYINLEGRDIWEYPLNLTPEEVDFLLDHLLEMERSRAPYYFFTDNCSYEILKVLDLVRPGLAMSSRLTSFVIPIDTVKVLRRETNLSNERIFKKSLKTDYIESFSRLDGRQKKELDQVIVQYKISETSPLSKKEKAEVLETATKYLAIRSYRTGADLDEEIYQLSSERAVLGSLTEEQKPKVIQAPDESHDSSAIYLGAGEKFYSFKFRSAFHDLEQPDFGTVHMSQTDMGMLDFRYETDLQKFKLDRLTFLDLINLNPSNQLDRNISWKVRLDLRDQWKPETEGGGGMSFDFHFGEATRLGYFFTGFAKEEFVAAGPEVLILFRPFTSLGISMDLAYFGVLQKQDFFRMRSKLNWNFTQNFDMQIEGENRFRQSIDFQVRLVKNFLF